MENNEQNRQPVIDVDYIDKLLSTYSPKTAETAPAPEMPEQKPVETEPEAVSAAPVSAAPAKKRPGMAALLLTAGICLLLGFFLGRLSLPSPEPNPETSEPSGTVGIFDSGTTGNPGIAVDYAAMSTKQLTDIAIQIPELKAFGSLTVSLRLTPDIYERLKRANPVLIELEQRPDAVEQLTFYNLVSSSLYGNPAATALIEYYVGYLGFDRYPFELAPECEWVVQDSDLFTVYEYTEAPSVYFMIDEGGSGVTTVFNFGGCEFYLQGNLEFSADNANFWYRMELTPEGFDDGFASVPDPEPELTWFSPSSSAWVTWQKSDQGWFIYGYAPSKTELTFTVYPSGNARTVQLTVFPVPEDGEDPAVFAQCVLDQALTLQVLSYMNPNKDLASYPIVEAVLVQPFGISALLNLAQTEKANAALDPAFSISINVLVPLLTMPTFSDRMTANETAALQLLRGDSHAYLDLYDLSRFPVSKTTNGFALPDLPDYRVGDKPESLLGVLPSMMNYRVFVPLTESAMLLRQPNWELEVRVAPGAEGQFGAWPVYNTDDLVMGWIVSGKLTEPCDLNLQLCQGDEVLCVSAFRAQPLNT